MSLPSRLERSQVHNFLPDYTRPLRSFLAYQAGKINKYDEELFKYCRTMGFDLGTILAIYFAHKKTDIMEIFQEEQINNLALTKILILKKLSAEQKFRDAYGINSDNDITILKENERLWI